MNVSGLGVEGSRGAVTPTIHCGGTVNLVWGTRGTWDSSTSHAKVKSLVPRKIDSFDPTYYFLCRWIPLLLSLLRLLSSPVFCFLSLGLAKPNVVWHGTDKPRMTIYSGHESSMRLFRVPGDTGLPPHVHPSCHFPLRLPTSTIIRINGF